MFDGSTIDGSALPTAANSALVALSVPARAT